MKKIEKRTDKFGKESKAASKMKSIVNRIRNSMGRTDYTGLRTESVR